MFDHSARFVGAALLAATLVSAPAFAQELSSIDTNSHFLNVWKFSVSNDSSSFLCVVCVWLRQSVIALRKSAKLR